MGREISAEKLQDMIRSILPSTRRKRARAAKTHFKREARRKVRAQLRRGAFEDSLADVRLEAQMRTIVDRRRGYDKLNHFMRWCRDLTYGMTRTQALAYVREILPRNVIGDHAYGHWDDEVRYGDRYRDRRKQEAQSRLDRARWGLRRALETDPTIAGTLNALIKSSKPFDVPRRMLHGIHDVDAFVRAVLSDANYAAEKRCLRQLIVNREGRPQGRPSRLKATSNA